MRAFVLKRYGGLKATHDEIGKDLAYLKRGHAKGKAIVQLV